MEYTEELKYIQEEISGLRIRTELSRKPSQVKFIYKYKELVKLAKTNIFRTKGNF